MKVISLFAVAALVAAACAHSGMKDDKTSPANAALVGSWKTDCVKNANSTSNSEVTTYRPNGTFTAIRTTFSATGCTGKSQNTSSMACNYKVEWNSAETGGTFLECPESKSILDVRIINEGAATKMSVQIISATYVEPDGKEVDALGSIKLPPTTITKIQ